MNFKLNKSIDLLKRTPSVFKCLFNELNHDWTRINEGIDTWSAYDIIGHLIHGEKTDWIPRARIILSNSQNKTFEPFDRFAQEKDSVNKTMDELLNEFEELRITNLEELKSWQLTVAELNKVGVHPVLGEVTLKELLATWTIHDMVHLNQASRVLVKHYSDDIGPFSKFLSLLN